MAEDETRTPSASEEAKRRFRAALDSKKSGAQRSADGRANTGAVHGPEVTGGNRKTFRRKTG